ncbi:MAG: chemotaxis protein CheA [Planktothrix sp. GU0601_MAG3]|nr:MAG: chemotaxis protein CheA [Planktothrix sp. GU0601_MAG3]
MGELVVNRNSLEQDQERMRQFLDNLLHQVSLLGDVGQRMQDFYERSLLEISLLSHRRKPFWFSDSSSIHDSDDSNNDLDSTELDRFTPFHTLSQEIIELIVRVRESSADIGFLVEEADQVTRELRRITTALQEGLNRARMEPFGSEADALKRPVRDISIKCGKQAELFVEGRDTLIDKMLLGKLHDPLIHLVNNAITHGIEPADVRTAAGKSAVGRISIRVFHQGNQTIIAVSDDGSGIDVNRVKNKAIQKGIITAEDAESMSNPEIYDLLFLPNFSTKDVADEFAGRGVGMDVVRTSLTDIRGAITTDSTLGRGTTFTIRLPLNMSISRALCCVSDRVRIAFPMDGVEDMIDVPREQIRIESDDSRVLEWRGTMLPLRHLRELLTYHRHLGRGNVYGANVEEDMISVIVLRSSSSYLAVQVDQVLIEQEIVIKPLEGPVPKPIGIAGATVLGDGQIVAIADVLELIDLAMGRIRRDASGKIWQMGSATAEPQVSEVGADGVNCG